MSALLITAFGLLAGLATTALLASLIVLTATDHKG